MQKKKNEYKLFLRLQLLVSPFRSTSKKEVWWNIRYPQNWNKELKNAFELWLFTNWSSITPPILYLIQAYSGATGYISDGTLVCSFLSVAVQLIV